MIAGMDEAGRGPAIGPLVFGLVLVDKDQEKLLQERGVNDSKQLSKKQRDEFKIIIEEVVAVHAVLEFSASEISDMMEVMTLNEIEIKGFRELLIPHANQVSELQLDAADVNAQRFGTRFNDLIDGVIDSRHKGDSIFTSVGAASILAKVRRDEVIEQLQEAMTKSDPDLPSFGSGYPTHAKPFLEAYVKKHKRLPVITRRKWKTSTNALEQFVSSQSKLDEFF